MYQLYLFALYKHFVRSSTYSSKLRRSTIKMRTSRVPQFSNLPKEFLKFIENLPKRKRPSDFSRCMHQPWNCYKINQTIFQKIVIIAEGKRLSDLCRYTKLPSNPLKESLIVAKKYSADLVFGFIILVTLINIYCWQELATKWKSLWTHLLYLQPLLQPVSFMIIYNPTDSLFN